MYLWLPRGALFNKHTFKFMSIIDYIKETQGELKHVSWPTRRQAFLYTALVIVISVGVSFYLGLFDYIFSTLIEKYIL
jgi:preprotein translocase subunit SecE